MIRLPHEVSEAQVVGFPAIKFSVAVKYDTIDERYRLYVKEPSSQAYLLEIGSFPTDVAHILLDTLADL